MKYFYAILIFSLTVSLFGWNALGPTDYTINDYLCADTEVLCTNSGLLIYDWQADEWSEYSNGGLPVWQAIRHVDDLLIVIMGNGSYSDGIWFFNLETGEFTISDWVMNPNFIYQTVSGYYVGYEFGLIYSEDLETWTDISALDGYDCVDMEMFNGEMVVSTFDIVFHSIDNGETWNAPENSPLITDMTFDQDGKLWGVFPSTSNSSGLYSSDDLGETWDVEMWSMNMSCVYWVGNQIYIAWENDFEEGGVARWNPTTQAPEHMNEGLPNLVIKSLTTNDMVDCYNLVACTEQGAYIEFSLEVSADEEEIAPLVDFSNYPNPFSDQTTFQLNKPNREIGEYSYEIYNIKGELIQEIDQHSQPIWNSSNKPSGIYLVKLLRDRNEIAHQKITLIK